MKKFGLLLVLTVCGFAQKELASVETPGAAEFYRTIIERVSKVKKPTQLLNDNSWMKQEEVFQLKNNHKKNLLDKFREDRKIK